MKNSTQYHFADFTTANYRKLLRLAKEKYQFRDYTNFKPNERFLIWRHDVDLSMHRAVKLARIEAEEGVSAIYFILLHSLFYNLLDQESSRLVREIHDSGHMIGLHFDSHYYGIETEAELEAKLGFERELLEKIFEIKISTFCFHISNPFTLGCDKPQYAGLINAYSSYFQKEVDYCSDSNGYWRFARLEDLLVNATHERLQVLTHPELWQDRVMSPKERVNRCADLRAERSKEWYDDTVKKSGRENLDW